MNEAIALVHDASINDIGFRLSFVRMLRVLPYPCDATKAVTASLQPYIFFMIVFADIQKHRGHVAVMNPKSSFLRVQAWPLVSQGNVA